MVYKGKTKNQKKSRASAIHVAQEEFTSVPHSFVFHRGQIGKNVQELITNMRRVMEPFTATSLKYSLVKDVVSSLKRHRMHEQQFTHPPLLVLNNFGLQGMHIKLMATVFQHLFPSINVHKVNLNTIRRCILMNYDPETQLIEFRHYSLKVVPVGMSKGMKKLLQEKFPNMSKWEDISELLVKGANLSESEAEQDGEHNITELPQLYAGRGNMKAQQSAVRLTEIGPRMTLQLVKIQEGLNDGNVLYHSFVEKSEEELKATLERKEKKLKIKAQRRQKQEQDIQQKKEQRDENKKKSLDGIARKKQQMGNDDSDAEDPGMADDEKPMEEEDDDVEYYRQEVGQEPDADLLLKGGKRKGTPGRSPLPIKKFKTSKRCSDESGSNSKDGQQQDASRKNRTARSGDKFSDQKGPGGKFRKKQRIPGGKFTEQKGLGGKYRKSPRSPDGKFSEQPSPGGKFHQRQRSPGGKFGVQQSSRGGKVRGHQQSQSPVWKNHRSVKSPNARKQELRRSPGGKSKLQQRLPRDGKRDQKFRKQRMSTNFAGQGQKRKPGFKSKQGGPKQNRKATS
ncbi:suppressor of SWI4 1 homolog isoform X2 [Ambystoma mexicanum]|uniref:suppressor of SWI4 1 homolog isoform X2 n=1 Tax=Ambystoma mexicanum TaxID=8296 RepID=UPI0037E8FF73